MNIGLGLIAADEYFKEGDRREVRADQRDRRAYDQQLRQADLSVLDDRTAATRGGYLERVAEQDARNQTRPGQTANTIKRQGVEGVGLDRAALRQGAVEDTADINAELGLGQARANQTNQPAKLGLESDKLKVDSAVAAQTVQLLPQKLAQAAASGVIQQRDAQVPDECHRSHLPGCVRGEQAGRPDHQDEDERGEAEDLHQLRAQVTARVAEHHAEQQAADHRADRAL